jgi:hypothetical protein
MSNLQALGTYPLHGGCPCTHTRYTLSSAPLVVHACHCTHCQRETGTAFATNAFYEPDRVVVTLSTGETGSDAEAKLLRTTVPSLKGGANGQVMTRCPKCYGVLWSEYGSRLRVVRVGTLDGVINKAGDVVPVGGLKPDAHLFAGEGGSKHVWVNLDGEKVYESLGRKEEYWSQESLERWEVFVKNGARSK